MAQVGGRPQRHEAKARAGAELAKRALAAAPILLSFSIFFAGPPSALEFDGPYGVYHSAYDDFFWMNHFGDPGYQVITR